MSMDDAKSCGSIMPDTDMSDAATDDPELSAG